MCLSATSVLTRLLRLINASLLKSCGGRRTRGKSIINVQGVPRYAGVVEGTDNGRHGNRNHGAGRHCRRRVILLIIWITPGKLVTLNPKLKSTGAGRYQLLSCCGCLPQAVCLKDFSPKSQDAVALQQIKERGALPMIDRRISGQAIGISCSNIHHRRAGYGQF